MVVLSTIENTTQIPDILLINTGETHAISSFRCGKDSHQYSI